MRTFGGALLGLLILYGIARGSLADYTPDTLAGYSTGGMPAAEEAERVVAPGASALLRLSWRTRGESVNACRRLSDEEVEAMPMHMRREEVCERRILPWLLSVELDGIPVLSDTILPAGARQDRPLYVYRDLPLRPGRYQVAVRFEQILAGRQSADRENDDGDNNDDGDDDDGNDDGNDDGDDDDGDDDDDDDDDDDRRRGANSTPDALSHSATIDLAAGEIALITYDTDSRALVLRQAPRRDSDEAEDMDELPEPDR